ncbi:MAG TPA: 50S ribosomal protein L29 [bacterium]|nr:50S ribosomal protein L29 [bacterium]
MKKEQLRELSVEELEIRLEEDREELENLRFQQTLQQVENPLRIRHLRKEIAQILTVLREYELGIRQRPEGTSAA